MNDKREEQPIRTETSHFDINALTRSLPPIDHRRDIVQQAGIKPYLYTIRGVLVHDDNTRSK